MGIFVNLIKVGKGKNGNHLKFEGYVPTFDVNKLYKFEFYGTGIETNSLPEDFNKKLAKELSKDFGHAPFDVKSAKAIFDNGKEYTVDF